MAPSRTKPSTPRLSELARQVAAPSGVVSTGWPAVEAKCAELGISFRPWQPPVGRLILAKRASGKYAATIGGTGLSIPRQVGKTFLVAAIVFALCLLRPGLTVIWTAHRLRTAEETFGKMQAFARRAKIKPHIAKVVLGSGEEEVRFVNGSRILFGARERGFGRGFDEVDVLIFDEAQILTDGALDDMVPATNQSRQETSALLLFMGTPPKPTDPGEVFRRMRAEALSGEDEDTGWVEFGADPKYQPPQAPEPLSDADWRQVAKANPSYPQDTPREAILRMRKKLGHDSFLREGLGIWDERRERTTVLPGWDLLMAPQVQIVDPVYGVDVDEDRMGSIVAAWAVGDVVHVEMGEPVPAHLLADRVKDVAGGHPVAAPSALVPDLERVGVRTIEVSGSVWPQACAGLIDRVKGQTLRHANQPALTEAVGRLPKPKQSSSDAPYFMLRDSQGAGPALAMARAVWALTSGASAPSVYENREPVALG